MPSPLKSWNFVPLRCAAGQLPKSTPEALVPDERTTDWQPFGGAVTIQPLCCTSHTWYDPGLSFVNEYVPSAPVVVLALTAPESWMVQPPRPGSPGSRVPLQFRSSNFVPEIE